MFPIAHPNPSPLEGRIITLRKQNLSGAPSACRFWLLDIQKAQFDAEIAEHELNGFQVINGCVQVANRPKFIAGDFGPLPSERLNPSEAGRIVSAPASVDNRVPVTSGVINL